MQPRRERYLPIWGGGSRVPETIHREFEDDVSRRRGNPNQISGSRRSVGAYAGTDTSRTIWAHCRARFQNPWQSHTPEPTDELVLLSNDPIAHESRQSPSGRTSSVSSWWLSSGTDHSGHADCRESYQRACWIQRRARAAGEAELPRVLISSVEKPPAFALAIASQESGEGGIRARPGWQPQGGH